MSQVRLSIPFVGGVTKVYEQQEFNKEMKAIAEKAKWTGLVLLGAAFVVGEVVTRHTANGLQAAANAVADVHDDITHRQAELNTLYVRDAEGVKAIA
jgi:hypothetical protein